MPEEREILEVDVVFVGAGPASLAGAYHLANLLEKEGESDLTIAVLEKGKDLGAHGISGAVMDPRGLRELIPDFLEAGAPIESRAKEDRVYFLTQKSALKFPINPPFLNNHGNYIISLGKLVPWLGKKAEEKGVNVFTGFPGAQLLLEGETVVGVRTGDKGIDRFGNRKTNYEPGIDIRAKVTVLGEGPRGSLTKQIVQKWNMHGLNPQVYSAGVKEVWEVPAGNYETGRVIHTMGFPLKSETFGGGFIYGMANNFVSIGFVTGLDYKDPFLDPHNEFQKFKTHPLVRKILEGGKVHSYGAKTIPEGGWYSVPKLYAPGLLLIGDSASLLNGQRLKGIHLAIKSGMLAAETIHEALKANDYSASQLKSYEDKIERSWIKEELWKVRNFHQAYDHGLWIGMIHPDHVHQMLSGLYRAMKPGSPIVLETVNPLSVFSYHHLFFKDPTHIFPVHPDTLKFMLQYAGFQNVQVHLITPVPEQQKLPEPKKEEFSPAAYEYLRTITSRLNQLLYDSLEYYVTGVRP